jgi:hypothetical protein
MQTDIRRFLPFNEYQAAVNANSPTALNPFATIADLPATPTWAAVLAVGAVSGGTSPTITSGDELIVGIAGNVIRYSGGDMRIDAGAVSETLQITATDVINIDAVNRSTIGYGSGASKIDITSISMLVTDTNNSRGLVYAADYSGAYTVRSLTDKGYNDSHIASQTINALVSGPGAGQDGYFITWDNTAGEYTLTTIAGADGDGMFDVANEGGTWSVVNATTGGATTLTIGTNDFTFLGAASGGKVHINNTLSVTPGDIAFQVSARGVSKAFSTEINASGVKNILGGSGANNEVEGVNFAMNFMSDQYDGSTIGVDAPVFSYHTVSSNYVFTIGKLRDADTRNVGFDVARDIDQGLSFSQTGRITASGALTADFGASDRTHNVYGIESTGVWSNSNAGGDSVKIGLRINITNGDRNEAIRVIAGESFFADRIEVEGGAGVVLEDTVLGSRHEVVLTNGSLTIGPAL